MRAFERFPNLVTMFFTRAAEQGEKPFLWAKKDGRWQSISWREAAEQVASLAAALQGIGLRRGDRVMLVSENRPEWCIADLAIMAAGCVTVPTYTTNTERDHQHILDDSGARAVIVSTQKLARTLVGGTAPVVTLSTAHPAKFPAAVKAAAGIEPALPAWLSDLYEREERYTVLDNDQAEVERFIAARTRAGGA